MLYNNFYDYETGKFSHRIPNSKTDKRYKKDLKLLYSTFTGNIDYDSWNKYNDKTFKDVILSQYNKECSSKEDKDGRKLQPVFKMKLIRNKDSDNDVLLFKKYADHIKTTTKAIEDDRKNILAFLQQIFVVKVLNNNKEVITINPKLNEKMLDNIFFRSFSIAFVVVLI